MSGGSKANLRKQIHRTWGMRHRPDNEPQWQHLMVVAGFCPTCGHNGHRQLCQAPIETAATREPCDCDTVKAS